MVLYLSVILIANIVIDLLNILFGTVTFGYSPWFVILAVLATTVFEFVIDGVFAIVIKKLPDKWFAVDGRKYDASKRTQKFYEKLKIKSWKEKIWELGGLGGFRKNKINEPSNPEYIEKFIIESNKGIVTHRGCYIVGFLGIFLFPLKYALVIGLPVACVNMVLNMLPTMALRYNLPKLRVIHKRLTRNAQKNESDKEV